MKSINLLPPKNPNRLARTWLALVLIVAIASAVIATVNYYAGMIRSQTNRTLLEARELERQIADYMEMAIPRVSIQQLNEFERQAEAIEAARINWESHLERIVQPLPQTAILHSMSTDDKGYIHIRVALRSYDDSIAYIRKLEQLQEADRVSLLSYAENFSDQTESIPVRNADGAILYYDTETVQIPVFELELQVRMTERAINHE